MKRDLICFLIFVLLPSEIVTAQDGFRVFPYLQNPAPDAMTIMWFSGENSPGLLSYGKPSQTKTDVNSDPLPAEDLAYSTWEDTTFFGGHASSAPFRHRVRIENLEPATNYEYTVTQGANSFSSSFHTAPQQNTSIRFIVYGDPETEPESTGKFTDWVDPVNDSSRLYLIDQTAGYQHNLDVIKSRRPDLIFIAGDLVETGGEQRDWDEFWRHNADQNSEHSLAGAVPVMGALGNHDYFEGPYLDEYDQPGSERAVHRYLTYFESPANHSPNAEQEGRYYSFKYGPVLFIVLDVCNNDTNKSGDDTNYYLLGESDPLGGNAPDFGPGSRQYQWLEERLIEAQLESMFTFVIFHHAPYSSGLHNYVPGEVENVDNHPGNPVRILTPVFMKYGVDAVFSGHDELWERSEVSGIEIKPGQQEETHTIHFYDVGTGGDGLRGPVERFENPYQKFLAHRDAPEIWENGVLKSGGKHYGHLEVDIIPGDTNSWQAILKPVYIFPLFEPIDSGYTGYERRIYDDQVILTRSYNDIAIPVELTSFSAIPGESGIMLTWETPSEKGNYGFELQRRLDSVWQAVTFLEGNGTTSQSNLYEYLDTSAFVLNPGIELYYRLKQVDVGGNYYYSDSIRVEILSVLHETGSTSAFSRSYPNPFKTETTIEYYLPEPCQVAVKIFDLYGKLVRMPDSGNKRSGLHKITWDGRDELGNAAAPGIYFFRIETGAGKFTGRRMILLK